MNEAAKFFFLINLCVNSGAEIMLLETRISSHHQDFQHVLNFLSVSDSQIDVLQAEVTALKTLVLTSTPSSPNRQLHPQLQSSGPRGASKPGGGHSRNKSTGGTYPPPHGKPESSSVSVQPVANEDREVT